MCKAKEFACSERVLSSSGAVRLLVVSDSSRVVLEDGCPEICLITSGEGRIL